VLLDAGALIALFASDDRHHARFYRLVKDLSRDGLQLLTTWPCVVEASHLLNVPMRFEMLRWIEAGGAIAYGFEASDLGEMIPWMERYTKRGGREMDLCIALLAGDRDRRVLDHDDRCRGLLALPPTRRTPLPAAVTASAAAADRDGHRGDGETISVSPRRGRGLPC
jgi:hypothetical protein